MNANEIVSQLSTSAIVELMGCDSVDGMRRCAEEKGLIPKETSEDARNVAFGEVARIQSWANAHITSCGLIADVSLPEKGLLDLQATGIELPDWMDGHEFEAAYAYLRFFGQIWDQIPVDELVRVAELPGRLDRDALATAAGLSVEEAKELTRTIVADAARRPSHLRR